MKAETVISGQAITGEELVLCPVDIIVEGGRIAAINDNPRAPPVWICPAFFNAHTHLGDTIAMDCGNTGDLVSLVTPPGGLKHRLLAAATRKDLVAGMHASVSGMIRSGTMGCADFREGGREGVLELREAVAGLNFCPVIFGRDGGEAIADGLGVSSTRDLPGVEALVRRARNTGKKVAFHAGECDGGDIDAALAFEPDLLVHMTHATKKQLRACADQEIPIAVCPRSNWILGVTSSGRYPPVGTMIDLGCKLLLGTDNVMFVPPDMLSEMAFLSTVYHLDPRDILRSAVAGSALTGTPFFIREGARAAFFTLDPGESALLFSRDPVASLVKRAQTGMRGNNVFNLKTQ